MMKERKEEREEFIYNSYKYDKIGFSVDQKLLEPFVMTIEIDQGKTHKIYIYPNSDPEEISYEFCKNNNLDFSSLKYLKQEIQELLQKFKDNLLSSKLGECINEVIHEEDENNSLSNNDIMNKNISSDKSKIESERENKILEKKIAVTEAGKDTIKFNSTYLNSLCLTSENKFDIIADKQNLEKTSQINTVKNESKKSSSNVYDKLYQDSRFKRIMSLTKTTSTSLLKSNFSPPKIKPQISDYRSSKTSLLNQFIMKKSSDERISKKTNSTNFLTYTNNQKILLKSNNIYISPNKCKSNQSSLAKSLKSFSISDNTLTKTYYNSPKETIKSPNLVRKNKSPMRLSNFSTNRMNTNNSPSSKVHYDLFTKLKMRQFTNIFKLLDQDKDGMINQINATMRNVPTQIIKILKPIFSKMEEEMKNYSLQEFVEECDEVFKKSTYLEKKILINFNKFYDKKKNISVSYHVANDQEKIQRTRNNIMTFQYSSNNDNKNNNKSLTPGNITYFQQNTKNGKTENYNINTNKYNYFI